MNARIPNFVRCLIFFSLFRGIRGDFLYNEGQGNIASRPQQFRAEHNFGKTVDVIKDDNTVDDKDFDDKKRGKKSVESFKFERKRNESYGVPQRKERQFNFELIKCLTCSGTIDQKALLRAPRLIQRLNSDNCYRGINISSVKCGVTTKQCFTELHPFYIRRGCYDPNKVDNIMTFYCKCSLCNDKPADRSEYFTYDNEEDWMFDNRRLQMPNMPGVTLICQYCNTTVSNCYEGKKVPYMICKKNQVCFTTIEKAQGIITRGCANKPAYNAFFSYCDENNCNNKSHWDPEAALRVHGERADLDKQMSSNSISKIDATLLFISFVNLHSINTL